MNTKIEKHQKNAVIVAPIVLLFIILIFTNPQQVMFPFLLVPFVLVFLSSFLITRYVYTRLLSAKKYQNIAPLLVSLFPVLLLLLRSLRQLSFIDVFVVIALLIGVLLYVRQLEYAV